MSSRVRSGGRSREIEMALVVRYGVQANAALWTDGEDPAEGWLTKAVNALDAAADTQVAGATNLWLHGAYPADAQMPRADEPQWYMQEIRLPFRVVQASAAWASLITVLRAVVIAAFPGIPLSEMGRFVTRPNASTDLTSPARFVEVWYLDREDVP